MKISLTKADATRILEDKYATDCAPFLPVVEIENSPTQNNQNQNNSPRKYSIDEVNDFIRAAARGLSKVTPKIQAIKEVRTQSQIGEYGSENYSTMGLAEAKNFVEALMTNF